MRKLFILGTTIFWLTVIAVWLGSQLIPDTGSDARLGITATRSEPEPGPEPVLPRYSLAEISGHSTPENCWMAINDQVYDLTAYLPDHPSRPEIILPWCGKEASDAFRTKTRGRSHSTAAAKLLTSYHIGVTANLSK